MSIKIDRRFLVSDPIAAIATTNPNAAAYLRQGYLGWINGMHVRVRIATLMTGERTAVLTQKSRRRGFSRVEFERPVGADLAQRVLDALPADHVIRKKRYRIYRGPSDWAVDFFDGPNAGLVTAEIELVQATQLFELPSWAGAEVTLDPRYDDFALARQPHGSWATLTPSERRNLLRSA